MTTNKEIKELFSQLPASSQSALLDDLLQEHELQGSVLAEATDAATALRGKKPCPHCTSTSVYKRGKQNGVQCYNCRACGKWYSETTGTPLYHIHLKSNWQSYLRCMEQGMPIKAIAREIGISIQTSFDWRHKILSSLSQFVPEQLSAEIECDELELPLNNKGDRHLERPSRKRGSDFTRNQDNEEVTVVQVVTAAERKGNKYLKPVETKRLSKEQIAKALDGKIEDGATLITDKHPSYKAFAKDNPAIKHKALLAKEHVDKKDKTIHLQKVNSIHAQLRKFLMPFNGVSSKYLQNYLNWFAYADKIRNTKTTIKQWLLTMLLSEHAYHLFNLFKSNAINIRT